MTPHGGGPFSTHSAFGSRLRGRRWYGSPGSSRSTIRFTVLVGGPTQARRGSIASLRPHGTIRLRENATQGTAGRRGHRHWRFDHRSAGPCLPQRPASDRRFTRAAVRNAFPQCVCASDQDCFADPSRGCVVLGPGYWGAPGALCVTENGGRNWRRASVPAADVGGVEVVDRQHLATFPSSGSRIWTSEDFGRTWRSAHLPIPSDEASLRPVTLSFVGQVIRGWPGRYAPAEMSCSL